MENETLLTAYNPTEREIILQHLERSELAELKGVRPDGRNRLDLLQLVCNDERLCSQIVIKLSYGSL